MGGDTSRNNSIVLSQGEEPSYYKDFNDVSSLFLRDDDSSTNSERVYSLANFELEAKHIRRYKDMNEILMSSENLRIRSQGLEEPKAKILSYKPGAWIENSGGLKTSDYEIPATTSILLVGPKGAGKSSLVNWISKVFDNDKFASERAQVTYNPSVGDGTLFLQEYMIPRDSTSFCLYDTRSLSDDSSENMEMLKHWMTRGVRNGQPVIRNSDDQSLKNRMECKASNNGHAFGEIRKVNSVIFVIDGDSVLKLLTGDEDADRLHTEVIVSAFNSPHVSFLDDKPLVVVTHGDLLSHFDRARVRVYLGELLGIPPTKQIFDIPEEDDPATELSIVDLLRYSLERADKNLPRRSLSNRMNKVNSRFVLLSLLLLVVGVIAATVLHGEAKSFKHLAKADVEVQTQAKPQASGNIQEDANFPKPQGKDDIQGQVKFKKPKEDDIRRQAHDAKDNVKGRAKFANTQTKDEPIQWHKIRYLWLGDDV